MEDFVSFKLAQRLKEKGFDWICSHYYRTTSKDLFRVFPCEDWSNTEERVNAPTISQVLKWLRDEKKLHIEFVGNACGYLYIVSDIPSEGGTDRYCSDYSGPNDGGTWDKYEDCALNAIQYVLDNLI